jgi:hypothetical protein
MAADRDVSAGRETAMAIPVATVNWRVAFGKAATTHRTYDATLDDGIRWSAIRQSSGAG